MIFLIINLSNFESQVSLLLQELTMDFSKLVMVCSYSMEVRILRDEGHLLIYGILEFIWLNKMFIILNRSIKGITSIIFFHGDKDFHFISYRIPKTQ